jgi:cell division protein FtsW (lipid II flippase)
MTAYMKRHERYILEMLGKNLPGDALKELLEYHDKQITWLQHERTVHLLTMLFVCLFTLLCLGFTYATPSPPAMVLCAILGILTLAYIIHYYRLENGVQRWYDLSNKIRQCSSL